jgi:hypothetical protein
LSDSPDLSFVIVTDSFDRIALTVRHLRAQANHAEIELVIVVPAGTTIDPARSELRDFHGVQLVEVPSITSIPRARVPGVRRARAHFVALGETHSFPLHGWAEALLAAHARGWDVVGPAVTNANPSRMLSWANLLLDYGRWLEPSEPREMDDLPGHNSSYRREILAGFSDHQLIRLLESDTELHRELRTRGYRLLLDSAARLAHTNVTRWASTFRERFSAGRRFASARAQQFSLRRRLVYVLGSPLIPFIRLPRILRDIRGSGRAGDLLPGVLAPLCVCLVVSALGELAGYVAGSGSSTKHLSEIELDKLSHLRWGDTLIDETA